MEREHDPERAVARAARPRTPEAAPALRAGTLPWASAVGNAAVARLARQTAMAGEEEETAEAGAEEAAGAPEAAGMEPAEAAGLADVEVPEDELPE